MKQRLGRAQAGGRPDPDRQADRDDARAGRRRRRRRRSLGLLRLRAERHPGRAGSSVPPGHAQGFATVAAQGYLTAAGRGPRRDRVRGVVGPDRQRARTRSPTGGQQQIGQMPVEGDGPLPEPRGPEGPRIADRRESRVRPARMEEVDQHLLPHRDRRPAPAECRQPKIHRGDADARHAGEKFLRHSSLGHGGPHSAECRPAARLRGPLAPVALAASLHPDRRVLPRLAVRRQGPEFGRRRVRRRRASPTASRRDYEPANRLLMDPVLQFGPWLEFTRSELRRGPIAALEPARRLRRASPGERPERGVRPVPR